MKPIARTGLVGAALGCGLAAAQEVAPAAPAGGPQRVAVVVAVSNYPNLPAELQTARARDQARELGRYLEDHGGYGIVHTLLDGVATHEAVRRLVLETVPPTVKPGDTLLVAFIGHGTGGDIEDPYLLLYDSRVDALDTTALKLQTFGRDLAQTFQGVNIAVITDGAHQGDLQGVALIGPSAKNWPAMPGNVFLLSAAAPSEVAPEGMFMPLLLDALEGDADANADGKVTASELHRNLLVSVAKASNDTVHPAEAGTYDPGLVVGLATRAPVLATMDTPATPPASSAGSGGGGWGGLVSYSLMGGGAALSGFGGYLYFQGKSICEGEVPCTGQEYVDFHDQWGTMQKVFYGAGAGLVALGVGLAFVPLEDGGALVGWRGEF